VAADPGPPRRDRGDGFLRLCWLRLRRTRLSTQLVVFGTLLTLLAVGSSFLALSLQTRSHTRRLLTETLSRQQRSIREVEQRRLEQLLETSTLLTDSPTLRAAIETYRSEGAERGAARDDLLATIREEVERAARRLERDLLVVTDDEGRVLAATGRAELFPRPGENLSAVPVVRHALSQHDPPGPRNLAVLERGGRQVRLGAVPILLQGYLIGVLAVGDEMDRAYVEGLRESFECDVVLQGGERILATTLADRPSDVRLVTALATAERSAQTPLVRLHGTEYVTAPIPLGADDGGRPVTLYLLHSLDRALGPANRELRATATFIGFLTLALAGLAAAFVARSVLGPLSRFSAFMREVAETGDRSRRFPCADASHEVGILVETYNELIESLQAREQELLRHAREDLERLERLKESEKLAALGRMLSGAAHEINNPLTGVVGNIEMLLADERVAPTTRERLETVRKEGRRIVALVRNLLKIAHRDTVDRAPLDVNHVLREAVALRRHDFARAGIELRLDLAADPVVVSGNELELQQVFLNIINNAFDALGERAAPSGAALTVRSAIDGELATLTFTDNGPGISAPDRVFEHFFTTKPVGQGTGLGLSISRAIVQRHGGVISATNVPEGGARLTIDLPLSAERECAAPGPTAAPGAPAPGAALAPALPATVLVVDDEPSVLELQMAILDSLGASVTGVSSGSEAISCLEERQFDLIVSDLRMPGLVSGKELYRWVERNRPGAVDGFVFVTGDLIEETAFLEHVEARRVLKPFTMDEYVTALRETLHGRET
jgi:signal transduction histidine kinase